MDHFWAGDENRPAWQPGWRLTLNLKNCIWIGNAPPPAANAYMDGNPCCMARWIEISISIMKEKRESRNKGKKTTPSGITLVAWNKRGACGATMSKIAIPRWRTKSREVKCSSSFEVVECYVLLAHSMRRAWCPSLFNRLAVMSPTFQVKSHQTLRQVLWAIRWNRIPRKAWQYFFLAPFLFIQARHSAYSFSPQYSEIKCFNASETPALEAKHEGALFIHLEMACRTFASLKRCPIRLNDSSFWLGCSTNLHAWTNKATH